MLWTVSIFRLKKNQSLYYVILGIEKVNTKNKTEKLIKKTTKIFIPKGPSG